MTGEPARQRRLDEEIWLLRREVAASIADLGTNHKGDIEHLAASIDQGFLTQTRWMLGMWVGQITATAAIVAALFRVFAE